LARGFSSLTSSIADAAQDAEAVGGGAFVAALEDVAQAVGFSAYALSESPLGRSPE
jgi:hypothetical protein